MMLKHLPFNDYLKILNYISKVLDSGEKVILDLNCFETSDEELFIYLKNHKLFGFFGIEKYKDKIKSFVIQKTLATIEREKIIALLKKQKILFFELKGHIIEELLYKKSSIDRYRGDNDIYIPKIYLKKTVNLLLKNSYKIKDEFMDINSRIKKFGSFNVVGDFSICDIHFDINRAGKYRIHNLSIKEIFTDLLEFNDTKIPNINNYFRLLLFHFYAKHNLFNLGLMLELLFFMKKYQVNTGNFSIMEKIFIILINDFKKIIYSNKNHKMYVCNPIFLSNIRYEYSYFEKRLYQTLLYLLPSIVK